MANVRDQLKAHEAQLLSQIQAAATAADTPTLLSLNEDLRRTSSLLHRIDDIGIEARTLLRGGSTPPAPSVSNNKVAGRGYGVKIRSDFLDLSARHGLALRPHHGAIYLGPSGRRIGIAVATERKPGRWFLGLGDGSFDAAVLVCVPNSGKVLNLCLPDSFLSLHRRYFSRSGGQVKFNVARRGGHVVLKIPGKSPEIVDQFVDAIMGLDR